jgi:hypothetical protein
MVEMVRWGEPGPRPGCAEKSDTTADAVTCETVKRLPEDADYGRHHIPSQYLL